jgi:hypothetical protein
MVKGKFVLNLGLAGALAIHGMPHTKTTLAALGPLIPTSIATTMTASATLMTPWVK